MKKRRNDQRHRPPFYYGVCYYPEAWPVKRHADDIRRIADAGFNFVRMGEGAWSYWEPREGRFQFDLFDRVIDLCRKHKVKVILGTPTYAAPAWVSHQYPEVLRWDFNRIPMKHGSRRNLNYTSAKFIDLSDRICTALAAHYRDDDQVIAWQLDNEFNCHMDVSYAPSDTIAFRAWLRSKYKAIDALNDAWGTRFWSQTYDAWEQIDLPHPTATYHNPTQLLDESRFISDCVVNFAKRQAAILRRANRKWKITHNGLFNNVNGRDLMRALGFFSHDQYPLFYNEWTGYSFNLVQARSLSFPYAIMEQQSGPGGQMSYLHRTPRTGEMRLWAWQSIAHGAAMLAYFRWRTCPYGSEQHWHGLLDPDNRDNRRLAEARDVGREVSNLPQQFLDAPPVKFAAVLRDYDNEINERRINTYAKAGAWENGRWLAELAKRHVPHDIVWPDTEFTAYKLLIAPHLKIIDEELVTKLERFVRAGGTIVLGAQSGSKDRNCHLIQSSCPGLLGKLAGIEIAEWTTVAKDKPADAMLNDGKVIRMHTFCEALKPTGAEPIARWSRSAKPAITRNRFGKGMVVYIGGYVSNDAIGAILDSGEVELLRIVIAGPDVEAIARGPFICLLNHSDRQQVAQLDEEEIRLPAFGVTVRQAGGRRTRFV